ncbi:MAG: polysaccharide deacetylase family protein [Myxococcales bacterium]|nr:polysaccharide deacetylase family protein [Myxococcales bacterium]
MPPRVAAVSIDLDEVPCYASIHALDVPPDAAHAVYDRALPRLEALLAEEGVEATLFAIGRDLDRADNVEALRRLHAAGHELGNHSERHLYDLTRRDLGVMRDEVRACADRIEAACGERPRGFRAPGYTVNDALVGVLEALGVGYDSSVFGCPPYYAAKALALAAMRARGRRSRSVLDTPAVLRAPADPYRLGRPYHRRGNGLLELPIGVTSAATGRLPYIGTALTLAGPRGARWLTRAIAGRPLVNLELHGIDLADADLDGLRWLRPHQPDLRRAAADKIAALRAALHALRAHGYRFMRLGDYARALDADAGGRVGSVAAHARR